MHYGISASSPIAGDGRLKTDKKRGRDQVMLPKHDQKLIDEVLSVSDAIRYCSIIDESGNVIVGGMKKGVKALEPESHEHKLITQLAILMGADKDWDVYLGETDYFLIRKSKVNLMLFPMKGLRGVLVSAGKMLSASKLEDIRKAITDSEKV
jgi:hypothetical protein